MNTFEKIYEVVKQIPEGCVATYGMIAHLAGNPKWSRVVGYALHCTPEQTEIPWHRVVNRFGGLSFNTAENQQKILLEQEGVAFRENGLVDLDQCLWNGLGAEP